MKALKGFGQYTLGFVIFLAIVFLVALLFRGGIEIAAKIYPIINKATAVGFSVCLFILLPLAISKKARGISATSIYLLSYIFGLSAWILGLLVTYSFWGWTGVIIGLVIAGVGVVPLAFLASIIHGEWSIVLSLFLSVALVYGARLTAISLGNSYDNHKTKKNEEEMNFAESRLIKEEIQ